MERNRAGDLVTACCACGRIRLDGRWLTPEQVDTASLQLTHGYCPGCFKDAMVAAAALAASPGWGIKAG